MMTDEMEDTDDAWLIKQVARDRIILHNPRTDHHVTLGTDHIREYLSDTPGKSDGFIRLKSEILLQGSEGSVEHWTIGAALCGLAAVVEARLLKR
jgi:hypothetical protein